LGKIDQWVGKVLGRDVACCVLHDHGGGADEGRPAQLKEVVQREQL